MVGEEEEVEEKTVAAGQQAAINQSWNWRRKWRAGGEGGQEEEEAVEKYVQPEI